MTGRSQTALVTDLISAIAVPAVAEPTARHTPGAFVRIVRDYDSDRDAFLNAPAKGEGDACFQISRIDADGAHTVLISGPYHPWWSDAGIPPGTANVWSNSAVYLENRPNAAPHDQIWQIFATVPACPTP